MCQRCLDEDKRHAELDALIDRELAKARLDALLQLLIGEDGDPVVPARP